MASAAARLLTSALSLASSLSQEATNGVSRLGTLQAPTYPEFLTNNPLPNGWPWGSATAENTNPYTQPPNTGVTRYYDFTIKRGRKAPDGYLRDVILINDQYPGPTIEANWGDTVEVKVRNLIDGPEEGTAIHWHGLLQTKTPWYDGVPSVHQCPIAPNSTFTYRFQADLYGTSWYHGHYSSQYAGGLHGPMIIHGPRHARYNTDLGPVFINDYHHREYFEIVKEVVGTLNRPVRPRPENNLINGKMNFDCSTVTDGRPCNSNAGVSKFRFRSGRVHRLRLINSGADSIQKFSIDGHTMTVIANDFVPIRPYNTTVVTLGIGQRADVLVTANGKPRDAYWMRSQISPCSHANGPLALAAVYYENADTNAKPNSTQWPDTTDPCQNDPLERTVPLFRIEPPATPATTQNIAVTAGFNSTGHFLWFMNNQTHRANYNKPLLLLAHQKNTSYPNDPQWNVYNFGSNKTIRFVVENRNPAAHPMHMHGHNMYILAVGTGTWDGRIVNPRNPQRRDVQLVPAQGYLVVQIDADNPGVWPFHCHIAWHSSSGLYINVLERPEDIKHMDIPMVMNQTCKDWENYSTRFVVNQIDSGV